MNKYIDFFDNYVKGFDLNVKQIMDKYHHSYRVMKFCESIGKSLNMSGEEMKAMLIIGLYHDIARFSQWRDYQSFIDRKTVDHGDLGATIMHDEILPLFELESFQNDIIVSAIKNHNKLFIEELSKEKLLFAKVIRDADKLDIMTQQLNHISIDDFKINSVLLDYVMKKQVGKIEDVKSKADHLILFISWIFDFNFDYSISYLNENKFIDQKFEVLESCGKNENIIAYKKLVKKEMERRLNVR